MPEPSFSKTPPTPEITEATVVEVFKPPVLSFLEPKLIVPAVPERLPIEISLAVNPEIFNVPALAMVALVAVLLPKKVSVPPALLLNKTLVPASAVLVKVKLRVFVIS